MKFLNDFTAPKWGWFELLAWYFFGTQAANAPLIEIVVIVAILVATLAFGRLLHFLSQETRDNG